jgi:hypothetical protein
MPTPRHITRLTLSAAIVAIIAAAVLLWRTSIQPDPLHAPAREQWKNHALSLIQHRAADPAWIAAQTTRLQALTTTRPYANWVGEELLLMKNGDWIICQNVCRKQPAHIEDCFIGLGSNGKWYYSTFHFCVDKVVLRTEGTQPASLLQFVDAYSLRPFDGHSDDCLQSTWTPGQPYGVDYYTQPTQ